jgi:hypothetical protein
MILSKSCSTEPFRRCRAIKKRHQLIILLAVIFSLPFYLTCKRELVEKGPHNQELIRRNLFLNQIQFQIKKPYIYQYGSLHVDGPEGGMLYRFNITTEAFNWLVTQWNLEKREASSMDQIPLPALEKVPKWWQINQLSVFHYFYRFEKFTHNGERQLIFIYDSDSQTAYVVDDYRGMSGV